MKTELEPYEKMIQRCTWRVIQGITKGWALETVMYEVARVVQVWEQERVQSEIKPKTKRKDHG